MAQQSGNRAELEIISRFRDWDIFATLTFAGSVPSLPKSRTMVFAHLYRAARLLRTPWRRFTWAIRCEAGEVGGRLHYHALIGGAVYRVRLAECFQLNHIWDAQPGCGFARHRLYDRARGGVEYITTCLAVEGTSGRDFYETQKFGAQGTDVTLSRSLYRAIGGQGMFKDINVSHRTAGKRRLSHSRKEGPSGWACRSYGQFDYDEIDRHLGLLPLDASSAVNTARR